MELRKTVQLSITNGHVRELKHEFYNNDYVNLSSEYQFLHVTTMDTNTGNHGNHLLKGNMVRKKIKTPQIPSNKRCTLNLEQFGAVSDALDLFSRKLVSWALTKIIWVRKIQLNSTQSSTKLTIFFCQNNWQINLLRHTGWQPNNPRHSG